MPRFLLALTVLGLALGAGACNDDDGNGGTGGNGDGLHAVVFTAANAEALAGTVAAAMDLLSGVNGALLLVLEDIETYGFYDGVPMPEDGYDLGDLGICETGILVAKWMDVDDSRSLTAGDTVHLALTDCDGETGGTLDLAFTASSFAMTRADIDYALVFEEDLDGTPQTRTVSAGYVVEIYRSAAPYEALAVSHQVPDKTDGGSGLEVAIDGETSYRMGCFNFYFSMNPDPGGFLLSEPYAVFSLPGQGVMTLVSWSMTPYDFADGDTPVAGESVLWAESGTLPCSRLGIPGGGVVSNDSFLTITVDGDTITLGGETEDGSPIGVTTSWDELR